MQRVAELLGAKGGTFLRYVAVSGFNVVMHQLILLLANTAWGWGGGASNVFAAFVVTIPAYFLSRYWVWEVQGDHDVRRHVIPFWVIAFVGLVLSTVMAEGADRVFGSGLPVAVASLTGYVIVWMAKFVILDRLFTRLDLEQVDQPAPSEEHRIQA